MNRKLVFNLFITILTVVVIAACSTYESVMEPEEEEMAELTPIPEEETARELQKLLVSTRSKLSDVFTTQRHDMPEPFLIKDTTRHAQQDPFDGFRIQIISTRNMSLADSIASQFRVWTDTTITGYTPNAYVFFKQPFFKVHVGDFQSRSRANELSKLVKKEYPEAWVVHDRIDPKQVPADTAQISLAERKEKEVD